MRLFEVDTLNQMIDGELVEDAPTPATWLWTDRYYLHSGVMNGDQFAVEAWERQTQGGVKVNPFPDMTFIVDNERRCMGVIFPKDGVWF